MSAALMVHRQLGPGLLESTYQTCLAHELEGIRFRVDREVALPVQYGSLIITAGYRIDMLVEELVIVENKSIQSILPVHEAQLLTYLRLSGRTLGFLINWNVPLIRQGIKRMVNKLPAP